MVMWAPHSSEQHVVFHVQPHAEYRHVWSIWTMPMQDLHPLCNAFWLQLGGEGRWGI